MLMVLQLDGMPALRPRKERAMEKLNDWWGDGGILGVDIENARHRLKSSSDVIDPESAAIVQQKLAHDVLNIPGSLALARARLPRAVVPFFSPTFSRSHTL